MPNLHVVTTGSPIPNPTEMLGSDRMTKLLNLLKKFNMKKVLVIDNYDSFTYNLVHYLEDLDCDVIVLRRIF